MIKFRFRKCITAAVLLLCCNTGGLYAQVNPDDFAKMTDFMPPPPNASAIIKGDILSLNKNTGAPNINIPIYSIKGHKLSTDVSLSYNSSGIKIDEVSGRTGMGWSLSAGGVITRTLRGSPDESNTRLAEPTTVGPNCATWLFMNRAEAYSASGGYDGQPDLFNFSMNGRSGSFVFDASMNAVTITPEAYIITQNFSNTTWTFKITDNNGIIYYFGGTGATEKSKRASSCGKDFDQYLANAWYLTKIEHPNGEKIDLTYTVDPTAYRYDNGVTETMTWASTVCGNPATPPRCANFSQTLGVFLSAISNDFTKIEFSYTGRTDCTDKLISEIKLFDKQNLSVPNGKYVFGYSHITATGSSSYEASIWGDVRPQITPYLTSLQDQSKAAEFTRTYSFDYITPHLRSRRLSFAQDHWGYFNGKNNLSFVPVPSDPATAAKFSNAVADRSVDENKAKMGLLERITFPTGGKQEIQYEGNKYYDPGTSAHRPAAGLRVAQINTENPGEPASVKKYIYAEFESQTISSLYSSPQPEYIKNYEVRYLIAPANNFSPNLYGYCETIGLYSNSLNSLYTYQNNPLSYASVLESLGSNGEGGMTQTKFMVNTDYPGEVLLGDFMIGQPMTNASVAFNGRVKEEVVYKKGTSSLFPIKKTINTYHQDTRQQQTIYGYVANRKREHIDDFHTICSLPTDYQDEVYDYHLNRYKIWRYWVYLQTSEETQYDEEGLNPITKTIQYAYEDDAHLQLTKIETTDGEGRLVTTGLKYPKDYLPASVYADMIAANILTPVINYKQTKTGSLTPITEVETSYWEPTASNFVPQEIKKATQGTALISEGTFDSYDAKGNLLQYTDKSGIVNAIVWGYGQLYPVAKITNSTYAAAIAYLTGGSITALQTMDGSTLLTELHKIRTGLPNAFVTSYTYKHLAGVSAVADANNKITSYEYDSFNRLVMVRDQEGNVLKKICYNYQGQTEDCSSDCTNRTPNWQNTATALRCQVDNTCGYTGYREQEQKDMNTCSFSYNTSRWVEAGYDAACSVSPFVQVNSQNFAGIGGHTVTYYNTSTGISYPFALPSTSTVLGCIPNGIYNVHIVPTGLPYIVMFNIGTNTISGTPADFYGLDMSVPKNKTIKILDE